MARFEDKSNHPEYFTVYNAKKSSSPILNEDIDGSETIPTKNLKAIKNLLRKYEGDKDGNVVRNDGRIVPSKLKKAKSNIQQFKNQFEKVNKRRKNQGKLPYQEMPDNMQKDYEAALAKLDVIKEEIKALKEKKQKIKQQKKKKRNRKILKYGPQGVAKGEPLRIIDGQNVEQKNGRLYIEDSASPYDGMPVVAYRNLIVQKFAEKKEEAYQNRLEKWRKEKELNPNAPKPRAPASDTRVPRDKLPDRPSDKEIKKFMRENGLIE